MPRPACCGAAFPRKPEKQQSHQGSVIKCGHCQQLRSVRVHSLGGAEYILCMRVCESTYSTFQLLASKPTTKMLYYGNAFKNANCQCFSLFLAARKKDQHQLLHCIILTFVLHSACSLSSSLQTELLCRPRLVG